MGRLTLLRWAPIGSFLLAAACGSELRRVPVGPLPVEGAELGVVEYPPPPAKVEIVPAQPDPKCAWLDGHWEFRARRWRWVDGDWVRPPDGCYYVEPFIRWLPSGSEAEGTLYALDGLWVKESGGGECTEPLSCTGRPPDADRRGSRSGGRGGGRRRNPERGNDSEDTSMEQQ